MYKMITLDHVNKNSGNFLPTLWLVDKYKQYPNCVSVICNLEQKKLNENKFLKKFKEKFTNFCIWEDNVIGVKPEVSEEVLEELDRPFYVSQPTALQFSGICEEYRCALNYYSSRMLIYFCDKALIGNFIEDIKSLFEECSEKVVSTTKVNLITFDGQDYGLTECEIRDVNVDLDKHYNDDFKPVYKDISDFLNSPKSGLVILHGTQGTGKTYMIRHLVNNFDKQFIIINNSMMNSLSDPVFLNFILDHKNSVIILEDCEQLLKDRSENVFTNGISNILNMTDGLYSDILNIKFIATFNSPDTSIDKALMRKGRLAAKYKFDELSLEKTNRILKELGKPEASKGMTLADIYNLDIQSYEHKTRRKIGF